MGNTCEPRGDAPREDATDTAEAERVDPSGAGQEGADHAGLPRPCGGGNTHSHTPYAQTVGASPGRDLGAFGGVNSRTDRHHRRAHTMASRFVLQRLDPDAPTLSRAVQNTLRYGESC